MTAVLLTLTNTYKKCLIVIFSLPVDLQSPQSLQRVCLLWPRKSSSPRNRPSRPTRSRLWPRPSDLTDCSRMSGQKNFFVAPPNFFSKTFFSSDFLKTLFRRLINPSTSSKQTIKINFSRPGYFFCRPVLTIDAQLKNRI